MAATDTTANLTVVSLDAEVFVQHNYQYDIGLLAAFAQHVRSGRAKHVIAEVTVQEIKARIAQGVHDARSALRSYHNKARILRNSQSPSLRRSFRMPSHKRAVRDLQQQLADYLKHLNTIVIPIDSIKPSHVFARYFRKEPPFGPGRKKSEFPDAFAIEALRQFGRKHECKIAVVSGDPDWVAALENADELLHVERLEELLQTLQVDTPLLAAAGQTIDALKDDIQARAGHEATTVSFVVADRTAKIESISPGSVFLHDLYVVDANETTITFSADAWIGIELTVAYLDVPSYGEPLPWDLGGYKRYGYFRDPDSPDTLTSSEHYRLLGTVSWTPENPEAARLATLGILAPRTVPVYFSDYYSGS